MTTSMPLTTLEKRMIKWCLIFTKKNHPFKREAETQVINNLIDRFKEDGKKEAELMFQKMES